jgi:uncharacterized integral membrane protein
MSMNSNLEGAHESPIAGEPAQAGGPETAAPPSAADPADVSRGPRHTAALPAAMRRTRLGGLWTVAILGAVILVLLLVFILQNGQRVEVHLFGAHWNAPLGVALLMAAALGLLLVVVPGAGRIFQLKRAARRLHRDRLDLADQLDRATATSAPDESAARTQNDPNEQNDPATRVR